MIIERQEGGIVRTNLQVRLELDPDGVTAKIPLCANIRTDANRRIKPGLLRRVEKGADILLAGKINLVLAWLVIVPEA